MALQISLTMSQEDTLLPLIEINWCLLQGLMGIGTTISSLSTDPQSAGNTRAALVNQLEGSIRDATASNEELTGRNGLHIASLIRVNTSQIEEFTPLLTQLRSDHENITEISGAFAELLRRIAAGMVHAVAARLELHDELVKAQAESSFSS